VGTFESDSAYVLEAVHIEIKTVFMGKKITQHSKCVKISCMISNVCAY